MTRPQPIHARPEGPFVVFDPVTGGWVELGAPSGGGNGGGVDAYAEVVGDGTETTFDVDHGLGTTAVHVQVWLDGEQVLVDASTLDINTVRVVTDPTVPGTDELLIVVQADPAVEGSEGTQDLGDVEFAWVGGVE